MSIITKIDGIPLFSKKEEALRYARLNNTVGYHTHNHFGKLGYMSGKSHKIQPDLSMIATKQVVAKYYISDDPRNTLIQLNPEESLTSTSTTLEVVYQQPFKDDGTIPANESGSSGEDGSGGVGSEGGAQDDSSRGYDGGGY